MGYVKRTVDELEVRALGSHQKVDAQTELSHNVKAILSPSPYRKGSVAKGKDSQVGKPSHEVMVLLVFY